MNYKNQKLYSALVVLGVMGLGYFYCAFQNPSLVPQAIDFGPVSIRIYSLTMLAAVLASFWFAEQLKKDFHIVDFDPTWLLVWAFVGARAYHVVSDFSFYFNQPFHVFYFWNGGLSIYGGLIAGVIYLCVTKKWWFDFLTMPLLLGQIIGRLGNFFNYELYGYPTAHGMVVPVEFRPDAYVSSTMFHPLFLYEMVLNCIWLAILLYFSKVLRLRPGSLFGLYLFLYNIGRVFLEFLRIDPPLLFGLRQNVLVSVTLAGIGMLIFYFSRRHELST